MIKKMGLKRLFAGLAMGVTALFGAASAENWVPIASGDITIFVPQYNFQATKVSPGQYNLSWNAQSGATSYKVERLAADPETSATADTIQTLWQTVADTTATSISQTHNLASYDLAGHQNYRLSSCQATVCTEIAALYYFVSNSELQDAIPLDFNLTDTVPAATAKFSLASAENDHPYAYGYGYSYITGHDDPNAGAISQSKLAKSSINGTTISSATGGDITLSWRPVLGATHYVVSKIPDRGESPTYNRLFGEVNSLHAKSTSFNLKLSSGTYKFVVYACSGYGFCGLASVSKERTHTVAPNVNRQARGFTVPETVGNTDPVELRWQAPIDTTNHTGYEIAGELAGILDVVLPASAIGLDRNLAAAPLAPGRQYCYKIRPTYSNNVKGSWAIPIAPAPHCVKLGGEPVLPAPSFISLVGELGESDIHLNPPLSINKIPTLYTGYSISWGAVAGADYYQLEHELPPGSGNWQAVYSSTLTHKQQHFSNNDFEAYRVSACKANGYCGNYQRLYFDSVAGMSSNTLADYKQPACLNVPSAIAPGATIPVSWCSPQVSGVVSYELLNTAGQSIHTGTPDSFAKTLQGLVSSPQSAPGLGGQYCYSVKANFSGDSTIYQTAQKCGTVKNQAATATINPNGGDIYHDSQISFSSSTGSADFEYASVGVGGSCTAVFNYNWKTYRGDLTLPESGRICARTSRSDLIDSEVSFVDFTVVNKPPVITSTAATTVAAGATFSYQVTVEDTDSSSFTYELTAAPAGMTVNTTGLVSWVPLEADIGNHSVTVKVTDLQDPVEQTFALTVKERPPISAVDIINLNAQTGSFRVNWLLNSAPSSFEVVEEFNGVWGSPVTVNGSSFKDYSSKAAGRYRYKVGTCSGSNCDNHKISAAFTLSPVTANTKVSDAAVISGLSGDVGFTSGQFKVSEAGAATYSIPLNLPKGVAGVTPKVSLNYSSQGSDGIMGRGWSLGVGGAINRCPKNIYHNGQVGAVQYDASDLFCYQGQQLGIKSGTYGADGSVYYTKLDNLAVITAHGSVGSGPQYFTVATKSGDTLYFGQPDTDGDAFVEPNVPGETNDQAIYWALKKVVDVSGNTILYHYNEDVAKGSHSLASVEYGKNANVTGSRYFANVAFNYVANPKARVGYSGGSQVAMDQLLDNIKVTLDGADYRYYDLSYFTSEVIEERNYLESVTECLVAPTAQTAASHCLAPMSFTWQRPDTVVTTTQSQTFCEPRPGDDPLCETVEVPTTTNFKPFNITEAQLSNTSRGRQSARMFDINADGYADVIYEDNGWKVLYGPGLDSPTALSDIGKSADARVNALTIDYDGDGKQELLVANNDTSNWYALTSTGEVNLNRTAVGFEKAAQVMDVDGDGLQDIVFQSLSTIKMYRNLGGSFSGAILLHDFNPEEVDIAFSYGHVYHSPAMKNSSTIDVNGDGRSDLLTKVSLASWYCEGASSHDTQGDCAEAGGRWTKVETFAWQLFISSGTVATPSLTLLDSIYYTGDDLRVTDLNGDGLTDVVYRQGTTWRYVLSTGNGFSAFHDTTHTSPDNAVNEIFFVDLNGDGRADILKPVSTTSWDILLSRPSLSSEMVVWEKRGTLARNANDSVLFGDVNGDARMDLINSDNDNGWWVKYADRAGIIDNVITDFTNGWDVNTTVTYDNMLSTAVNIYDAQGEPISGDVIADTVAPVGPLTVVRKVESDSHTDGSRVSIDYRYGGMLLHREGLGSLGFKQLQTTDAQSLVSTTTAYKQAYPFTGMPLQTEQQVAGVTLGLAINDLASRSTLSGGLLPFIDEVTNTEYQMGSNGSAYTLATTVTNNDYDIWGNLNRNTVTIMDGTTELHTTVTVNNFGGYDSYEQQKGRLLSSTVTKTLGTGTPIQRVSNFTYYAAADVCDGVAQPQGILQSTAVNGLTTTSCYDAFGNKVKVTQAGTVNDGDTSATSMSSSSVYSSDGRAVSTVSNNLGHTTTMLYNGLASSGAISGYINNSTATDVNGMAIKSHFDGWGKIIAVESPDVATKTTKTAYCSTCTAGSKYYVEVAQSGMPTQRVIFDKFGREIANKVQHFKASTYTYTFKDYDAQGRVIKTYQPTTSNTRGTLATDYTQYNYDAYSRVTSVELPHTTAATHPTNTYAGLTTTKTDARGKAQVETNNLLGQLASVTDAISGTITYGYDAFGNLKTATKASATMGSDILQVSNIYDSYGRKTQINDIDKGVWNYRYNAFNDQVWQQSGNLDETHTRYDSSGRKIREYGSDFTQCWQYGVTGDTNGIGKIVGTRYFDGLSDRACTATDFSQLNTIAYDVGGRPFHTVQTVNNMVNGLNGEYHTFSEFDDDGRLVNKRYPGLGLTIRHEYNANGYAYKLVNADTNRVYQQITDVNASGRTTEVTYANGAVEAIDYEADTGLVSSHDVTKGGTLHSLGYGYDSNGNLTSRSHTFGTLSQNADYSATYVYDDLNRLTDRIVATTTQGSIPTDYTMTEAYSYDAFGNFIHKEGNGYYQYNDDKRLTGIFANANFSGAALYDFDYDNNGNIIGDGNRTLVYSSFDKAIQIIQGTSATEFVYGMGHHRIYRHDLRDVEGNAQHTHTAYLTGLEKSYRSTDNNDTDAIEYKFVVGNVIITERSNAANNASTAENYLHKDHLGSPMTITDKNGAIIQQNVYDPWGKVHQLYSNDIAIGGHLLPTTRGYTGHEGVKGLDIIHMNGRIYDPVIGRFMQADPMIQAPKNSQSYNRYAYVANNPLTLTDPSGYSWLSKAWKKIKVFIAVIIVAVASYFCAGTCTAGMWALIGGVAGGVGAAVNGGNIFTGALMGAFTAGASQYGTLAAALAGGIASKVQGGKFGHGFWAAGLGSAIGGGMGDGWERVVTAGVVGGTISELTGGKFSNGAVTSAFSAAVTASTAGEVQQASPDDASNGQMASAVYDVTVDDEGRTDIVKGYKLQKVHVDAESGMKAALFVNTSTGAGVLSFAGTSPTSWGDWKANIIQSMGGTSAQHAEAFKLAKSLYKDFASVGKNLRFTGHSLGGGIAATAAILNGSSATVFNAAGVHANSLGDTAITNGSVRYMYSSNDALRIINLMTPTAVPGQHVNLGGAGLHGMGDMCAVMGCK